MKVLWTKHAAKEAMEDNFDPVEIENGLGKMKTLYPEGNKEKGVLLAGKRYCTIIYVKMREGAKIITCWESSKWEKDAYDGVKKE